MKKFLIMTLGYEEPTPEVMEPWMAWFEKISNNTVDEGSPFGPGVEMSKDGQMKDLEMGLDAITGFRIIEVESMDEAKELLKGCPSISGVRIYELKNM